MALYSVEAIHQGERGHLQPTGGLPIFVRSKLGGPAMPPAAARMMAHKAQEAMPGIELWLRRVF